MTIETIGRPNSSTSAAQHDTLLAPRFYTTDFAELDKMTVEGVRGEWDKLIAEMRADPNKGHFRRNADWTKIELEILARGIA